MAELGQQLIASLVVGVGLMLVLMLSAPFHKKRNREPPRAPDAATSSDTNVRPPSTQAESILLARYRGYEIRVEADGSVYRAGGASFASLEEAKAFVDNRLK